MLKSQKAKTASGPLHIAELKTARDYWVKKVQRSVPENMERSGWKLVKDEKSGMLSALEEFLDITKPTLKIGRFRGSLSNMSTPK